MRGTGNHKLEEEGVALVQVAEDYENIDGCKTTKQQPDPADHDSGAAAAAAGAASNKAAEEAGYSYWSTWLSSAVMKKRVRPPGRVGLVVGGFVLLALLVAVATTITTTSQVVDFAAVAGADGDHLGEQCYILLPICASLISGSTISREAQIHRLPANQCSQITSNNN